MSKRDGVVAKEVCLKAKCSLLLNRGILRVLKSDRLCPKQESERLNVCYKRIVSVLA